MNKKILAGALVLGASTMFGLVGCGDKKEEKQDVPKYSVTFNDNDESTEDTVVQFKQGDTSLSSIPACPEKDGFAGVWDSFTLEDENITVNAKHGDGTKENPYMIATADQFANMVKFAGRTSRNTEYSKLEEGSSTNYVAATEADATRKKDFYQTCVVTYNKNGNSWKIAKIEVTSKKYFKLIADIDLSQLSGEANGGQFIAFSLDGAKEDGGRYKLTNVNGDKFRNTSGAIFENVSGSSISNIDVELTKNLASLAVSVRGNSSTDGVKTTIENVTISSKNNEQIFMSSDDNNESPFVAHVLNSSGNVTLNMTNCVNNANICSTAAYFGVFVGGYAQAGNTINFENCVNNGNIISSGKVGVFFGNATYVPTFNINNSVNNGDITAYDVANSHVLVADTAAKGTFGTTAADYYDSDSNIQKGEIIELPTDQTLAREYPNVKVTAEDTLQIGTYELILSSMGNTTGFSIMTNISITKDVTAETLVVDPEDENDKSNKEFSFKNVLHGMMDLNTYKAAYPTAIIPAATSDKWKTTEGYDSIKYFLDTENGCYVFDYSEYERENSVSGVRLNTTKDKVNVLVVVRHNTPANKDVINFVVG